jgi:cytochrome b
VAPGHNPLGALSVVALLLLLLSQIALGLFAVDVDGIESGPLSEFVSFEAGRNAAGWHEDVFNVLMVVVALHVLAVLYYLWAKKQNLIGAMVTGRRHFETATAEMTPAPLLRLVLGILLSAGLTWAVARAFRF